MRGTPQPLSNQVSGGEARYGLRIAGPAERQLNRLAEGTAAAIVEFLLGALLENPHRLGGELRRELVGMRSAGRGVYRIVYEVDEAERLVIVYRVEDRSTVYRPRASGVPRVFERSPKDEWAGSHTLI